MTSGALSAARLERMHGEMAGHVDVGRGRPGEPLEPAVHV